MNSTTEQQIQQLVNTIFPTLFHNIQCQTPHLETSNNKLYIPFLWHNYPHSQGRMVYDILSPTSISLDAFSSSPLKSLYLGSEVEAIDWIKLKYITKPPEISQFEMALPNILRPSQ
jgi:hypothetical protein